MDRISILTSCCDRQEQLHRVLPKWIKIKQIQKIVVVDYCSQKKISINHPSVEIVRVDGYTYFNKSHALNIGMKHIDSPVVLLLDCDMYLNGTIDIPPPGYFCANGNAPLYQQYGPGCLYVDDFYAINGLQEFCLGWGHEDTDFYRRLQNSGIKFYKSIDTTHLDYHHILRIQRYKIKHIAISAIINQMNCHSYINHVHNHFGNYGDNIGDYQKSIAHQSACALRDQTNNKVSLIDIIKMADNDVVGFIRKHILGHQMLDCVCSWRNYPHQISNIIRDSQLSISYPPFVFKTNQMS